MSRVQRLLAALWVGSAFFLMLAASAAFRAAPDATTAGDVVGAMLTRWHYIALAAPLALFSIEASRPRKIVLVLLFVAVMLAASQALVDLRIRAIRYASATPISDLDREDPLRKRFGLLHAISMALLLGQALTAAGVVTSKET